MSDLSKPSVLSPLDYGITTRRSRLKWWIALAFSFVIVGALWWNHTSLLAWANRLSLYHALFHAPSPAGPLDLSDAAGRDPKTSGDVLKLATTRLSAWTRPTNAAAWGLYSLNAISRMNGTGDPGLVFLGTLRTSTGHERLVALGCNIMVMNDLSKVFVSFHVELYDPGSYRTLSIATVHVNPSLTSPTSAGSLYAGFHWVTFDAIRYKPGTPISLGVPAIEKSNPAVLRLPLVLDGRQDALLFTLEDNDAVTIHSERGDALPLQVGFIKAGK